MHLCAKMMTVTAVAMMLWLIFHLFWENAGLLLSIDVDGVVATMTMCVVGVDVVGVVDVNIKIIATM